MKRTSVIAAVTAAALAGGVTATALAASDDDAPATGAARQSDDGARTTSVEVTAGDALAAALREVPGTAVSAELDSEDDDDDRDVRGKGDDGGRERAVWEVDVLAGDGTWHGVRIDPATGEVLGERTEDEDDTAEVRAALKGTSVGAAEAAKAAGAGHGTVTSVELDDDGRHGDGTAVWEVGTRSAGQAGQDWRVDGRTGEVMADRPAGSDSDDPDDSGPDDD
ncbi:PepSY domain-containing protein [Streptomyces sp. NPDC003719]